MDKKRSAEIVDELGLGAGFSLNIATYPVYLMLCGMALELLYKSIIVAKHEEPPTSHNLIAMSKQANIELDEAEVGLLQILCEYIVWSGRYPVPKKEAHHLLLHDLSDQHLYDHEPFGRIKIMKSNDALGWDSFNNLWAKAENVYWTHS